MATGSPTAPQRADLAGLAPADLEALYSRLDTLREDLAGFLTEPAFATLRTGLDRALVRLYGGICGARAHRRTGEVACGECGDWHSRQDPSCPIVAAQLGDALTERSAGFPVAIAETELRAMWGDR
jgi:hypothetical protein